MSYDISLVDPVSKETLLLDVPHQIKGGTYAIGGTNEAALNITYNYARGLLAFAQMRPDGVWDGD